MKYQCFVKQQRDNDQTAEAAIENDDSSGKSFVWTAEVASDRCPLVDRIFLLLTRKVDHAFGGPYPAKIFPNDPIYFLATWAEVLNDLFEVGIFFSQLKNLRFYCTFLLPRIPERDEPVMHGEVIKGQNSQESHEPTNDTQPHCFRANHFLQYNSVPPQL